MEAAITSQGAVTETVVSVVTASPEDLDAPQTAGRGPVTTSSDSPKSRGDSPSRNTY